jgi:hypothetical protein
LPDDGRSFTKDTVPTLRLKHPVTEANMSVFADDIVETARRVSGLTLDYSPASLGDVDDQLASFAADGVGAESVGETLFAFGAYVGEVFVRRNAARWRDISGTPLADILGPVPIVIELPDGRLANPIGSASSD